MVHSEGGTIECPASRSSLDELGLRSIHVNVCDGGCGGIWFEAKELEKVDKAFESEGMPLAHLPVSTPPDGLRPLRLPCPRCEPVVMLRRFTNLLRDVEVDEYPGCGGFWL